MKELELSFIPTDIAVFVPRGRTCSKALALLVDDIIGCGNKEFYKITEGKAGRFDVTPKVFPNS